MARKNFRIRPEGGNDFADVLHPETNVDMVLDKDGNPMLQDYVRFPGYSIATGTNNYVASLNPAPKAYQEGMRIAIKVTSTNTGESTLNINGLGPKAIVDHRGKNVRPGYLEQGRTYNLIYDNSVFQLLGKGGDYGTAEPEHVLEGKTIGTESGLVEGTMKDRGAIDRTITVQGGAVAIPEGYHNGTGTVKANFHNLLPSNIKKGVTIGGVAGTFEGGWSYTLQSFTYANEWPRDTNTTATVDIPRGPITSVNQIKMLIIEWDSATTRTGTSGSSSPVGGGYNQICGWIASAQYPRIGGSCGHGGNSASFRIESLSMSGTNIRVTLDIRTGNSLYVFEIEGGYAYIYYE